MDPNNLLPLYNAFGVYVGSASLLSSIGNSANDPISPSTLTTGQFNAQIGIVSGFLQSSNFKTGSIGWQITANGDVEFNSGTFRGTLSAVTGSFGNVTVATNGSISSGQTAYDTGTGFWMGNVSGTTKFSLGNSAGNKLTWNGTTLSITGSITATTGTIGGWTIGATTLTGGSVTLDSSGIITGGVIQTASSGQRIVLSGSTNDIKVYNSSGNNVGRVFGDPSGGGDFYVRAESGNNLHLNANNSSFAVLIEIAGSSMINVVSSGVQTTRLTPISNLTYDLGSTSNYWNNLYYRSVKLPAIYTGYVNSGASGGTPFPSGWSVSSGGTGLYTVTHNLGTTNYVVTCTPLAAALTIMSVSSLGSSSFSVRVANASIVLANSDWMFTLLVT